MFENNAKFFIGTVLKQSSYDVLATLEKWKIFLWNHSTLVLPFILFLCFVRNVPIVVKRHSASTLVGVIDYKASSKRSRFLVRFLEASKANISLQPCKKDLVRSVIFGWKNCLQFHGMRSHPLLLTPTGFLGFWASWESLLFKTVILLLEALLHKKFRELVWGDSVMWWLKKTSIHVYYYI